MAAIIAIGVVLGTVPMAQGASGTWELTWGKDVLNNGAPAGFEICTVAANCKSGASDELGGEFAAPNAVAVDGSAGFIYVADTGHDRIQKFDLADASFFRTWGKDVINGSGTGNLERCTNPAVCQAAAASTGLGGEMDAPEGVAVDDTGEVYVSERFNNRVERFDGVGDFVSAWGRDVIKLGGSGDTGTGYEICTVEADCKKGLSGGLGGELNAPNGIASDGTFIYVADRVNNRIQKFTKAGAFVRAWGKDVLNNGAPAGFEVCMVAASCKTGAASTGLGGELNTPVALAPDGVGNVYVADTNGSEVQKFSDLGAWDRTWGTDVIKPGGSGDLGAGAEVCTVAASCQAGDNSADLGGEFNQPTGIAADATGVFVSDTYNERIQEFDPSGRFFLAWGKNVDLGGGTGFETCSEAASCLQGASGGLGGEMQLPAGLWLNDGDLSVADGGNQRVQRFGVEAPVFPPPTTTTTPPPSSPAAKKKCKKKKHKRAVAAKKKCKKKRKK